MGLPTVELAREYGCLPGRIFVDRTVGGDVWRWDGEEWHVLAVGDVCLERDGVSWRRWDGRGRGWRGLPVEAGAAVLVTVHRDGLHLQDEMCDVVSVTRERGRTVAVRCVPWFGAGGEIEVPFEAAMPVSHPDEAGGRRTVRSA
jgi:hypothetical protein